jgi:hypothetical protein
MYTSKVPHVLTAFLAVQVALAKAGIEKQQNNKSQGFNFRGVDDVMYYLAPLLAEQSLIIGSRVLAYRTESKLNDKGKYSGFAYVHMQYVFTSAVDGSQHLVEAVGEGIDSADKASGKASSYAFKEAILKGFCVPVQGSLDPDFDTPEVTAAREPAPRAAATVEVPAGTKTATVTPIKAAKVADKPVSTKPVKPAPPPQEEPNEPELPEDEQSEGQAEGSDGTERIEAALARLISKEQNRDRVRDKLFQAHGITAFDQLDEDVIDEVIQQAKDFVAAQAARAAKQK